MPRVAIRQKKKKNVFEEKLVCFVPKASGRMAERVNGKHFQPESSFPFGRTWRRKGKNKSFSQAAKPG